MGDGFGGAILVEVHDTLILKAGYGWANREERLPFTPQTIAQIGSLTKQFTATAILSLAHDGLVDLDDTAGAYLPDAAEPGASLTLRQLLTHTAGMPEYCGHDFERYSIHDLLTKCMATPLLYPPGTDYAYSNPGFSVLGAIVQRVSGQSYESFLRDRFFTPLGITHTAYFYPDLPRDRFAVGYYENAPQGVISDQLSALRPDFWNLEGNGGMQSTVEDMYRWYQALSGAHAGTPDVLGSDVRSALLAPHYARGPAGESVGYGWRFDLDSTGQPQVMLHGGSDLVFLAYFIWRPVDRTFFYIVGNNGADQIIPVLKAARKLLNDATVANAGEAG